MKNHEELYIFFLENLREREVGNKNLRGILSIFFAGLERNLQKSTKTIGLYFLFCNNLS